MYSGYKDIVLKHTNKTIEYDKLFQIAIQHACDKN